MPKYKALLVSPDGDWVTDHRGYETVVEVEEALADQGSRWYFYPFHAVIRDHGSLTTHKQRLVSVAQPFEYMHGYSIKSFSEWIKNTSDRDLQTIMGG